MKEDKNEYLQMVEELMAISSDLSDWECQFVDSIFHQLSRKETLSFKQIDKLEELYDRFCG